MNPYFLHIALTTPLENLLALPNATGLAASLRENLAHLEPAQLQALLVCVDDWINDAVAETMWRHGGGGCRADRSDLEWLLAASDHWHEESCELPFAANWRDVLHLFALYKIGEVIRCICLTLLAPAVVQIAPGN